MRLPNIDMHMPRPTQRSPPEGERRGRRDPLTEAFLGKNTNEEKEIGRALDSSLGKSRTSDASGGKSERGLELLLRRQPPPLSGDDDGWDDNDNTDDSENEIDETTSPVRCSAVPMGAVANLCSATLGAGVLSLPYAFSRTGIVPGLLLLLLAGLCTITSIDFLVDGCVLTHLSSYEALTHRLLGPRGLYLVEASIFVFCFGTAVAYIVAVGDVLQRGVLSVLAAEAPNLLPNFVDREFCMCIFWAGVMLPLSLLERIDSLRYASSFGVASVSFLVLAIVVRSAKDLILDHDYGGGGGGGGDGNDNSTTNGSAQVSYRDYSLNDDEDYSFSFHDDGHLFPHEYLGNPTGLGNSTHRHHHHAGEDVHWLVPPSCSMWDVVRACPIIMFAFSCQVNVCAIYDELDGGSARGVGSGERGGVDFGPTRSSPAATTTGAASVSSRARQTTAAAEAKSRAMFIVTRLSVVLCTVLYALTGTFGYLDFGPFTQDNVLKNYCLHRDEMEWDDYLMIMAFCCIAMAVVVAFPLNVFPARVTLEGIVGRCCLLLAAAPEEEEEVPPGGAIGEETRGVDEGGRNDAAAAAGGDSNGTDGDDDLARPLLDGRSSSSSSLADDGVAAARRTPAGMTGTPQRPLPPLPPSKVRHVVLTILIAGSALGVALVVPDISVVFGLMGGTASSVVCFVLPGLFVLKLPQEEAMEEGEVEEAETRVWRKRRGSGNVGGGTISGDEELEIEVVSSNGEDRRQQQQGQPSRRLGPWWWRRQSFLNGRAARFRFSPCWRRKVWAWALVCGGAGIGALSTVATLYGVLARSDEHPLPDPCDGGGGGGL